MKLKDWYRLLFQLALLTLLFFGLTWLSHSHLEAGFQKNGEPDLRSLDGKNGGMSIPNPFRVVSMQIESFLLISSVRPRPSKFDLVSGCGVSGFDWGSSQTSSPYCR